MVSNIGSCSYNETQIKTIWKIFQICKTSFSLVYLSKCSLNLPINEQQTIRNSYANDNHNFKCWSYSYILSQLWLMLYKFNIVQFQTEFLEIIVKHKSYNWRFIVLMEKPINPHIFSRFNNHFCSFRRQVNIYNSVHNSNVLFFYITFLYHLLRPYQP